MSAIPVDWNCWYLTGPTATGKTALGIELARQIGAEIVSMDSMALYRGMDIGTAKPSPAERQAVRCHLIDLVEPNEEFSVARYVAAAHEAAAEIRRRGRQVLFVGGTPLYLKALLRGIFVGPPADWALRRRLQEEFRQNGPADLHRRVATVDPASAAKLHPGDTRRLIRALEVLETTGQRISDLQQQFARAMAVEDCRVFAIDCPTTQLHQRIDARVEAMFAAGLVEEVRGLLARHPVLSRTASQAVGYREVIEHIGDPAEMSSIVALVKTRTRQLAKRQRTWFRSLSECRHITISGEMEVESIARQISQAGRKSAPQ